MSVVYKARVWEVGTITGAGPYNLPGVANVGAWRTVAGSGLVSGSQAVFCLQDTVTNAWELSMFTYTSGSPGILTRVQFLESSTGSAITFAGNTCNITLEIPSPQVTAGTSASSGGVIALGPSGLIDYSALPGLALTDGTLTLTGIESLSFGAGTLVSLSGTSAEFTPPSGGSIAVEIAGTPESGSLTTLNAPSGSTFSSGVLNITGGSLALENNGTVLPGAGTLNFTNGTVSQSGSVVNYAGPTNSLTVVGATAYDNVNEIVFGAGLSTTATGGPQSIVQSAIFQEGGTCKLPNPVTIGNYLIVMALNNSISSTTGPGSTFAGLPLLQKSTQSAVNLCFIYGGVATSTVSPSVSYDSSVAMYEVSGVVGVVSALTELTDSSNLYSFEPSGNAPENLLFFINTSSNNFNSGVSDILPSPSVTGINTGSFGGFTQGGFSAYVTNVQSGNSVSFVDATDEFSQVIYAVLNGAASGSVNVSYEPGPAFSVYQSTAQTFAASTFTLLEFQTVEYDTGSSFSTSTYQYKPGVAGYYQINASMSLNGTDSEPVVIIISIFKNGTEYKRGVQTFSFQQQIIVSSLVEMNGTTDEISIYAYVSAAATTTAGSAETYFNGVMVRPA